MLLQARYQITTSNAQTKALSNSFQSQRKKYCFFSKFAILQKNKKLNAQPDKVRKKCKLTMPLKHNTNNILQGRTTQH